MSAVLRAVSPRAGLGLQYETSDQRVGGVAADVLAAHPPIPLTARHAPCDRFKVVERKYEAADSGGGVYHDGVVGHTAERLACLAGFDKAVRGQVDGRLFAVVVSVAALDRDAHDLWSVGGTRD